MNDSVKKGTALGELVSIMLGDIGNLHDSVDKLPGEIEIVLSGTKQALQEFVQSVPAAIESSNQQLALYDERVKDLYEKLLSAHVDFLEAGETVAGKINITEERTLKLVNAMQLMHDAVAGEGGMSEQTAWVAKTLEEKINQLTLTANSLGSVQTSKIAQHGVAVAGLKTLVVALVAFVAGLGFNPSFNAAAIVSIAVGGVAIGWALSWATSK